MTDTTAQRRAREHAQRKSRILVAARALAEADGWEKVTTRRLADAIEYSQPVLYGHFPSGKPEIVNAVALQGFVEMAAAMASSTDQPAGPSRLQSLAQAYLGFAAANPAVYEAMFALPIAVTFGTEESEVELKEAFDQITAALPDQDDVDTAAEVLWSSLHGLAMLERSGRLRPSKSRERITRLVDLWSSEGS